MKDFLQALKGIKSAAVGAKSDLMKNKYAPAKPEPGTEAATCPECGMDEGECECGKGMDMGMDSKESMAEHETETMPKMKMKGMDMNSESEPVSDDMGADVKLEASDIDPELLKKILLALTQQVK